MKMGGNTIFFTDEGFFAAFIRINKTSNAIHTAKIVDRTVYKLIILCIHNF
jgi:hypothetical protein